MSQELIFLFIFFLNDFHLLNNFSEAVTGLQYLFSLQFEILHHVFQVDYGDYVAVLHF